MSAAPGVLVEFRGACPLWSAATRGFAGFCATGLLTWVLLHHLNGQDPGIAWIATGICAASIALLAGLLSQPAPQGCLIWNTQDWVWHANGAPSAGLDEQGRRGSTHIALDLGDWMLLRFDPQPAENAPTSLWLPLSRARAGGNWRALQCALRQTSAGFTRAGIEPTRRIP